ncbi:hypothetical protein Tco_0491060 [Tanacetum coccineum]
MKKTGKIMKFNSSEVVDNNIDLKNLVKVSKEGYKDKEMSSKDLSRVEDNNKCFVEMTTVVANIKVSVTNVQYDKAYRILENQDNKEDDRVKCNEEVRNLVNGVAGMEIDSGRNGDSNSDGMGVDDVMINLSKEDANHDSHKELLEKCHNLRYPERIYNGDDLLNQQKKQKGNSEKITNHFTHVIRRVKKGSSPRYSKKTSLDNIKHGEQVDVLARRKRGALYTYIRLGDLDKGTKNGATFDRWEFDARERLKKKLTIYINFKVRSRFRNFHRWKWRKQKIQVVQIVNLRIERGTLTCGNGQRGKRKIDPQVILDKRMQGGDKVVYVLVLVQWASGIVGATWNWIEDVMKSFIRFFLDA